MTTTPEDPGGLMILHAWVEPGNRMRVQMTWTVDLTSGTPRTSVATSAADTQRVVAEWLNDLASSTAGDANHD